MIADLRSPPWPKPFPIHGKPTLMSGFLSPERVLVVTRPSSEGVLDPVGVVVEVVVEDGLGEPVEPPRPSPPAGAAGPTEQASDEVVGMVGELVDRVSLKASRAPARTSGGGFSRPGPAGHSWRLMSH